MRPELETDDAIMTNFDHSVSANVAAELVAQPNKICAQHSGWNFCGYAWWDGENFQEEVWVYNSPVKTVQAPNLEALMAIVNEEFGWD